MGKTPFALLSEGEWEGVPVPLSFQTVEEGVGFMKRLDEGEDPAVVVPEALKNLQEKEDRYPDAPIWDRGRTLIADALVQAGHYDHALDVVWAIKRPRIVADLIGKIVDTAEDEAISEKIPQRVISESDTERQNGLIRAFRDRMIREDPGNPMIDDYNRLLAMRGIESDPVAGWAESQKEELPEVGWDMLVTTIKNDAVWADVSVSQRQYVMLNFAEISKQIVDRRLESNDGEEIGKYFDVLEDPYPDAEIWGQLRGNLAVELLKIDEGDEAVKLAVSIRDSRLVGTVAMEFMKLDKEEEAIELASRIPDAKLAAEVLMHFGSENHDEAVRRLAAMMEDEDLDINRRIAFIEVIRDAMKRAGQTESVERYQDWIDRLNEDSAYP